MVKPTLATPAAVPAEAAAANATASEADPVATRNAALVSRGLSAVLAQKGGSLTMQLAPESLGSVKVQMTIEQGQLSLSLEASTQRGQQILTDQLAGLKSSLEAKGMTVERAAVSLAPTAQQADAPNQSSNTPNQQHQHQHHRDNSQRDAEQHQQHPGQQQRRDGREHQRGSFGTLIDQHTEEFAFTLGVDARA